jgi:hypothetical protein
MKENRQHERESAKKHGICMTCFRQYAKLPHCICSSCLERSLKRSKIKIKKSEDEKICYYCGKKLKNENKTKQCPSCKEKRKREKEYRKINKLCVRCGNKISIKSKNKTCKRCLNRKRKVNELMKKNKLCLLCGKKHTNKITICKHCDEKNKKERKENIKNGICPECKKEKLEEGYKKCKKCLLKRSPFDTYEEFKNKHIKGSIQENAIRDYIIKITNDSSIYWKGIRTVLKSKKELDIYSKDKNFAIEVNGILHFEEIYGKEKLKRTIKSDIGKDKECKKGGIKLYKIDIFHKTLDENSQEIEDIIATNYGDVPEETFFDYFTKNVSNDFNRFWRKQKIVKTHENKSK